MNNQIAIHFSKSVGKSECVQTALIEQQQVVEILKEDLNSSLRVGNIYNGKIVRLLPGLRMAFVEIGEDRTALLHFAQVPLTPGQGFTDVAQYLRIGQYLPVQITKLPRGEKGAVVTGFIQIVGAFLIYQPYHPVSFSFAKRITDEHERERLQSMQFSQVMFRSFSQGQPIENIQAEYDYLQQAWQDVKQRLSKKTELLRAEWPLAFCIIRDKIAEVEEISVDNEILFLELQALMKISLQPWLSRLHYHSGKNALWQRYKIDTIVEQAMTDKVSLPSGGFIVVEQTEAMITVDVNTGSYVNTRQGDILFQTNLEAARKIAEYLRLCNLGGIIVIDFIGMKDAAQQQTVLNMLRETLAHDSAHINLYGFSPLGLVEISRQRRWNTWK